MVHLKTLFLHNNLLVEVPTSLSQLSKLAELSLDWLLYLDERRQLPPKCSFDPNGLQQTGSACEHSQRPSGRKTLVIPASQEMTISTVISPANRRYDKTDNSFTKRSEEPGRDLTSNGGRVNDVKSESVTVAPPCAPQGNRKVLKGERGLALIHEIRLMLKSLDHSQRNKQAEPAGSTSQL